MSRNGLRMRSKSNETDEAVTDTVEGAGNSPTIDTTLVGELARLLSASDLAELEIEKGDLRIRMVRYSASPAAPQMQMQMPASMVVQAAAPAPVAPVAVPTASDADHPGALKSPMVGTAYRRASPESKPFVELGAVVKAGDKVLLVEAMKTFNEILAPRAGTVTAIFIDDGQPVEYGEPLLVIE